jgi:hypothetical protein
MDYSKGKIYKLYSPQTDKIYIGSTCRLLCQRMGSHRSKYKEYINNAFHYITCFDILKFDDCKISLIENVIGTCKKDLHKRERFHIESNKDICVNKMTPSRTHKERYELNKDDILISRKQYYEDNKQKISDYKKEYQKLRYKCECGSDVVFNSKSKHLKSIKHLKYCDIVV